jgi:hypothetical protein
VKSQLLVIAALVGLGVAVYWRDSQSQRRHDELASALAQLRSAVEGRTCPPPVMIPVADSSTVEAAANRAAELLRKQPATAVVAPQKPQLKPEPTHEQLTAVDAARDRLDAALVRGRLSRDDVLEMRKQLAIANSPEEASEIMRRLAVGINSGKLVPEDPQFIAP